MSGGWYVVNHAALATGPAEVEIYDDIGTAGIAASEFLGSLAGAREVRVRLNSAGGDVFDAMAIYTRLSELRRVEVLVDGVAASAATLVAMAASPGCLAMAPGARMMVHEVFVGGPEGNAAELTAMAAVVDALSDQIAGIYAARSGKPASYWRDAMKAETWYSAAEAVAVGLADTVSSRGPVDDALRALVGVEVRAALSAYRFQMRRRRHG